MTKENKDILYILIEEVGIIVFFVSSLILFTKIMAALLSVVALFIK